MENIERIRAIEQIPNMNSNAGPRTVNVKLKNLQNLAGQSCYVHDKEICFRNADDRRNYCQEFNENENDFGLVWEMDRATNGGAIFLTATRQTRANQFIRGFGEASIAMKEEIIELNRRNILPWHCQCLLFKSCTLYVYEPNFNLKELLKKRFASSS